MKIYGLSNLSTTRSLARSLATATLATAMAASSAVSAAGSSWFTQQATDITGAPFDFGALAGRVTLVTNVASR